jgi:hypothetical protein
MDHNAWTKEPNPVKTVNSEVVRNGVMDDINKRLEEAEKQHGCPLMTFNGRDALMDAYQEAIDTVMYLKQAIMERERIDLIESVLAGDNERWLELAKKWDHGSDDVVGC